MIAGQVFQFAVMHGATEFNIVFNLRNALKLRHKRRHHAALTAPKDIADLMTRIEAYHGSDIIRAALWFSLYTFQRPSEIQNATWKEIDFDASIWRISEQRMKNRRPHVVPLSRQVLELLKRTASYTGDSPFIFPSVTGKTVPMPVSTIVVTLRAMGYTHEQMTAHGFRALASTNLNEQGWNSDVIELTLSHVDRNTVRTAYNHAERLSERREMMQAWADWLDGLRQKAQVEPV